jgi:hypothetical protein
MAAPDIRGAFALDFAEQVNFFRKKLNLPTERWDDIAHEAHDQSFVVAGAKKADLLADLNTVVGKTIEKGTGLEAFRKDFKKIVAERGWHGWTGEGTKAGEAWRTRVIWETNLLTSYAAGRYAQLTDPELIALRPYWKYFHSDSVLHPRPLHVSWNGLVLRHDHPFWQTHYPPNGWLCHCWVSAVEAPGPGDKTEPPDGWDVPDKKTGQMPGIDKGWDYAPGASVADKLRRLAEEKAAKLPEELATPFREEMSRLQLEQARRGGASGGKGKSVVDDTFAQSARLGKVEGDARAWVIGMGRKTGLEHVILYDLITGHEAFRNVGEPFKVLINPGALAKAEKTGQFLRTVHNHPDSVSLSIADLSSLGHTVIREVEALGVNGVSAYLASRGTNFARVFQSRIKIGNETGLANAVSGLKSHARAIFKRYNIPDDIRSHIICQALEKEGVFVYTSTLSAEHERLYKHSLADRALADIIAFLKNHI